MASVALAVPPIVFRTPPSFPVEAGPADMAVADFNRDGRADLATANFGAGSVSVLLGAPGGGFGKASSYPVGIAPDALAAGDLNGDTNPDLVVANANGWNKPGTLSVLLGRGDGTFEPAKETGVERGPRGVVLADFNGDGKLDAATAISGGWFETNQVNVLLGRGDGTFDAPSGYTVGAAPSWLAAGDLNGDKRPDLVAVNAGPAASGNSLSVLLNQGDGTFATQTVYPIGTYPGFVLVTDVNHDGKADIATANRASSSVSILLGLGDGTFQPAAPCLVPSGAVRLATADYTGDGHADLAVLGGTYASGAITILAGDGAGAFVPMPPASAGASLDTLATAEFTGDSLPDLAVAGGYDSAVLLLPGRGDGTFKSITDTYPVDGGISRMIAADLNRDGQTDVATAHGDRGTVSVLLQAANGVFNPAAAYPAGEMPRAVKTADFNLDGWPDLVVANFDGTLNFLRGRTGAPGVFTNNWNLPGYSGSLSIGSNHTDVAVGDFNEDGKPDVVSANYYGASLSVASGLGNGTFEPGAWLPVNSGPVCLVVKDLDGDGHADVAVGYDGGWSISVLRGQGNGAFYPKADFATWEIPWSIDTADFNGDGKPDLVAAHYDWRRVGVLLNITPEGGPLAFGPVTTHEVANDPVCVATGDFNGDNLADVVSANYASVSVLLGLGDGSFLTSTNYFVGGTCAATGDFNLDGMPDVAIDLGSKVGIFWNDTLPRLEIAPVAGGVRIAYPAWKPYKLEATSELGTAGSWAAVTETPVRLGSQYVLTNRTDGLSRSYRLKRPAP